MSFVIQIFSYFSSHFGNPQFVGHQHILTNMENVVTFLDVSQGGMLYEGRDFE